MNRLSILRKLPRFSLESKPVFSFCEIYDKWKFNSKESLKEEQRESEQRKINPFFNEEAFRHKQAMNENESNLRSWHSKFQEKNGRKPSLSDMKEDPGVRNWLENFTEGRRRIHGAVFKFRIN